MPEATVHSSSPTDVPDYVRLIRFLVQPFLELPESLSIDCEVSPSKSKVWVRLAFEGSDKGRVFGRGGRNIQAIRTVLEGVARSRGYSAYLDVYGGFPHGRTDEGDHQEPAPGKPQPRRSSGGGRPPSRSRSH